MLAERLAIEVDDAFERLRREARNLRMKLHALAVAVIAREPWIESAFQAGRTEERGGTGQRWSENSSPTTTLARQQIPKPFDRRGTRR